MADYEQASASASAVAQPLTQEALRGLVVRKRKRVPNDNEDGGVAEAPRPRRFAPLKKARKKAAPTLQQTLGGGVASAHTLSSAYFTHPPTHSSRNDLVSLQYTISLINKCINEGNEVHFSDLRTKLHEFETNPNYNVKDLIDTARLLDVEGLRRIFAYYDFFPWDIVVDADNLYKRWMKGDWDVSLMRGVEVTIKKTVSYKLDRACEDSKKSAQAFGSNGLANGDWWFLRVCALRDGAHGAMEAGIHGKLGLGAYSIVLAAGGYADEDHGENILYCGTESSTSTPTKDTTMLRQSFINQRPVRVLRAAAKKSIYAPDDGIRYDGLYLVKAEELLDPATAMYRFSLERVPGQDPIRYQGPEKRPTVEQLREVQFVRGLIPRAPRA